MALAFINTTLLLPVLLPTPLRPTLVAPFPSFMALPPRSLLVGTIIQPDFVFNPGAPIARDLTIQYYDQPYFRDINVRRVFVIDASRNAVLLTTPMRVLSAWWTRERTQAPAPFLAISGWQDAIPPDTAQRYLQLLKAGVGGGIVSVAGLSAFHAVPTADNLDASVPPQPQEVMGGLTHTSTGWLRMVNENLVGVDSGTSFVADHLDFSVPPALKESEKTVMLLREEESDVAMASPMITMPENGEIADGIQFRGGYGAKWDDQSVFISLRNPFYSPRHRGPSLNRIWTLGG